MTETLDVYAVPLYVPVERGAADAQALRGLLDVAAAQRERGEYLPGLGAGLPGLVAVLDVAL